MPAYTLRDYVLRWEIVMGDGATLAEGHLDMPTMTPDESWAGQFEWIVPENQDFHLHLAIVRPTGFISLEKEIVVQSE
jgi:hypothetical protein